MPVTRKNLKTKRLSAFWFLIFSLSQDLSKKDFLIMIAKFYFYNRECEVSSALMTRRCSKVTKCCLNSINRRLNLV